MGGDTIGGAGGFRRQVVEPFRGDLLRQTSADEPTLVDFLRLWLASPGVRFLLTFRLGAWLWRYHHRTPGDLLLRLLHRRTVIRYGYEIPLSTTIGPGMALGHLGPIIVNHTTVIGRNANIHSGVVLGRRSDGPRTGSPTIGNDVMIAPGAKVIGRLTVGDRVAVAANSVVLEDVEDVEDGVTVAGLPAKVVSRRGSRGSIGRLVDDRGRRVHEPTT